MRDLSSNIAVAPSLAPAVQSASANGAAVDLLGFESAALVIETGAIAGSGLYAIKMQESDTTTDGDFTDVPAAQVVGTLPTALEANSAYKQGYIGFNRYIRAVITKTSGTSIAAGAVVVKSDAQKRPVAA